MTRTSDRLARAAAAVDRAFGEDTQVLRFKAPSQMKGPQPDSSRTPFTVKAKFFAAAAIEKPDATKTGRKHFLTDVAGLAERATIAIDAFVTPDEWPQRYDRLQRLELPGQPVLEVLMAGPDQTGRLTVLLGRVTTRPAPSSSSTGS